MFSDDTARFRNACLVVAHPDDEILWFSSVLTRVSRVFICFLGNPSRPKLGRARQSALSGSSLKGLVTLGLDEADVYDCASWPNPEPSRYGLNLARASGTAADATYRKNFAILVDQFSNRLVGFDTVLTHNPWGEYGQEEHVQVYRAVRCVQDKLGFELWCSAYVGSRSRDLMARCLDGTEIVSVTLDTDHRLALETAACYKKNAAWTWFDDYVWPERESFLRVTPTDRSKPSVISLNYLTMGLPPVALADRSLRSLFTKAFRFLPFVSHEPAEPI